MDGMEGTFKEKTYKNTSNVIVTDDIEKVSQWISDVILFIKAETILDENDSITKQFIYEYKNVKNTQIDDFKRLVGTVRSLKERFDSIDNSVNAF
ncbi:hypothetical protein [Clostridium uliginosum]|nr:hypothetical protein [Clostridium uliginosum]